MNKHTKNTQDFFARKLALDAHVPTETITWDGWRGTTSGWCGMATIDAPGCKVTSFHFTGSPKKWKFHKIVM